MRSTTRAYCPTCRHVSTFKLIDQSDFRGRREMACLRCGSRATAPLTDA
ncbi:hypothetical protein [Nocardioides sp.]